MQTYEGIWTKRQLVPNWIIQCMVAGIFGVVAVLLLVAAGYIKNNASEVNNDYSYLGYSANQLTTFAAATGGVLLFFCLLTIVFDIIECVLFAKRKLNPVIVLVFACIKTAVWGIFFILNIISAAKGSTSIVGIFFGLSLTATSVAQLIYGAKLTNQKRKGLLDRGHYKPTGLEGGSYGYSSAQAYDAHSGYAPPVYQQPVELNQTRKPGQGYGY